MSSTHLVLIVIDQLEELFTLADPGERERFWLAWRALWAEPRCALIFTLRADFHGAFMESPLWNERCASRPGGAGVRGFYGALGDYESAAEAYRHGNAAIRPEGLFAAERPQLKVRHGFDASTSPVSRWMRSISRKCRCKYTDLDLRNTELDLCNTDLYFRNTGRPCTKTR